RNYYDETVHQVNVIDVACEEYAQEVLGFLDSSTSGNPTPSDPIIASSFPSLTPFEGKGDILYLEKLLNEDPSPNLLPVKNDDLKQVDVTMTKPSIEEPSKLKLKDLPSYLEYAFLEGTDKLPVIIYKVLKDEEKTPLLKDDFKPAVQHQRRMNSKIHEVIKKEVIKILDAGLIYPIFDSPWMDFMDIFKFPLTHKTKKRLPSHALMVRLPTDACLSAYVMLRARFKDKMLKRCEDTNIVLNWEKCHFMVKEGIFLGHKISKSEIEVDRAKVDVIDKLPHPTSVK
nr:reverse transcriptase domain-containing protein [Tanacetum cinerariifolium]